MSTTTNDANGAKCGPEDLESYSGVFEARAEVCTPKDDAELRAVLAKAHDGGRRVTVRAGGHAFDQQSLPDAGGLVVSMCAFANLGDVHPDPVHPTMTVGAGATWGAIVKKLAEGGFVAPVTVTTEHATAGGTLAGDCLSRFSPSYGKFGEWIESFVIVTVDGSAPRTCRRPAVATTPWHQLTIEEQLFYGAIGGLGYLGAVTSITFKVLKAATPIHVATEVEECQTFEQLAGKLARSAITMQAEKSSPTDPAKVDAIYSALACEGGREEGLLMRSRYTTAPLARMPLHRPDWPPRILVEWLMRVPWMNRLIWSRAFNHNFRSQSHYVDELAGFTFFMDGNVNARRVARGFGWDPKIVQQTFIVPADEHPEVAADNLVAWLRYADELLERRKLHPTLSDILYLPSDDRFLLSATAGLAGFAVTYTFETSKTRTLEDVKKAFSDLTDHLAQIGGRIYLVKNVFAKEATVRAMYAANAAAFFRLKCVVDPKGLLANEFLVKALGSPPPCLPSAAAP